LDFVTACWHVVAPVTQEMLSKEYADDTTEKGNPQFKNAETGTIMLISAACKQFEQCEQTRPFQHLG
jgi:hypothetical protein